MFHVVVESNKDEIDARTISVGQHLGCSFQVITTTFLSSCAETLHSNPNNYI